MSCLVRGIKSPLNSGTRFGSFLGLPSSSSNSQFTSSTVLPSFRSYADAKPAAKGKDAKGGDKTKKKKPKEVVKRQFDIYNLYTDKPPMTPTKEEDVPEWFKKMHAEWVAGTLVREREPEEGKIYWRRQRRAIIKQNNFEKKMSS